MAWRMNYKKGIFIDTWAGICVEPDSEAWDLDATTFAALMKEAAGLYEYARDIERLDYLDAYASEGPKKIAWILENESNYLDALNNMATNPIATREAIEHANHYIHIYETEQASKKTPRTARKPKPNLRQEIINRDQSTCRYCGEKLKKNEIHIDHVIPYSLGGLTNKDNLVVACAPCNMKKSGHLLGDVNMTLQPEYF